MKLTKNKKNTVLYKFLALRHSHRARSVAVPHTYLGGIIGEADNATLNHLVVEIVAFTRPLPHTGKHGVATVSLGHIVDQLHDEHSLTHTSTSKQTWRGGRGESNV